MHAAHTVAMTESNQGQQARGQIGYAQSASGGMAVPHGQTTTGDHRYSTADSMEGNFVGILSRDHHYSTADSKEGNFVWNIQQ
jgi:hypothetical protein